MLILAADNATIIVGEILSVCLSLSFLSLRPLCSLRHIKQNTYV
jgi:hypothetical protein